ncbi:protein GLUTAMINE DUMPER 2 [Elaeis guineensis]|uniref:Protein GLUTAMINE DUMPER 2 n=1 Tax=Elaeis guineensis var. tenera TaxID=51953 RepID=A0A6I9QRB7_ELAGV|nr:protein GLUTAMINE DUMPER 2 [Elaeis guineensis]
MRPGAEMNANGGAEMAAPPPGPHSAWHSPVPYLFGGLAAMLGLIAFALLILACSYWKLSGYLESGDGDVENPGGDGKPSANPAAKPPESFEPRIVVIMAGDEKPTFLATPISSRAAASANGAVDTARSESVADVKKPESTVTARGSEPTRNHRVDGERNHPGEGQNQEQ